jgi:hypothetical protein
MTTLFTLNESLKQKLSEIGVLGLVLVNLGDALDNFIQIPCELHSIVTLNRKLFKAGYGQYLQGFLDGV